MEELGRTIDFLNTIAHRVDMLRYQIERIETFLGSELYDDDDVSSESEEDEPDENVGLPRFGMSTLVSKCCR